ncbi:hypothetical protein K402DRAFT_460630 [Aulographum hederae CBS 113979]|uniref:Uncharacterized protein n=1 Tax=Aulographum hederae CBS 113979 TaxID=1176131 RepID=A0A6G1H9N7_9PEZI|nr:hypothetical protein K402DRAFT_460630 [Aulographum hederae CBS 113979]
MRYSKAATGLIAATLLVSQVVAIQISPQIPPDAQNPPPLPAPAPAQASPAPAPAAPAPAPAPPPPAENGTTPAAFGQPVPVAGGMQRTTLPFESGLVIDLLAPTPRNLTVNQNPDPLSGSFVTGSTGTFTSLAPNSFIVTLSDPAPDLVSSVGLPFDAEALKAQTIDPANTYVGRLASDKNSWVVDDSLRSVSLASSLTRVEKMTGLDGEFILLGRQSPGVVGNTLSQYGTDSTVRIAGGPGIQEAEFADGMRISIRADNGFDMSARLQSPVPRESLPPDMKSLYSFMWIANTTMAAEGSGAPGMMKASMQFPANTALVPRIDAEPELLVGKRPLGSTDKFQVVESTGNNNDNRGPAPAPAPGGPGPRPGQNPAPVPAPGPAPAPAPAPAPRPGQDPAPAPGPAPAPAPRPGQDPAPAPAPGSDPRPGPPGAIPIPAPGNRVRDATPPFILKPSAFPFPTNPFTLITSGADFSADRMITITDMDTLDGEYVLLVRNGDSRDAFGGRKSEAEMEMEREMAMQAEMMREQTSLAARVGLEGWWLGEMRWVWAVATLAVGMVVWG